MKAPFPYFGGKSSIAHEVWSHFGRVDCYIEPFAGSYAAGLASPYVPKVEILNDADCMLVNFWRAMRDNPEAVAKFASHPAFELDLHARHRKLVEWRIENEKLFDNPEYYDSKMAGWWAWGISNWLGGSWCQETKKPPKRRIIRSKQGVMTRLSPPNVSERGVMTYESVELITYFQMLASRLAHAKILWGGWHRAVTPIMLNMGKVTAVFLDPPYLEKSGRDLRTYAKDSGSVAEEVRQWAIENGNNKRLRIALCGFENEHSADMPDTWKIVSWSSSGGYGAKESRGKKARHSERIWFSPHCQPAQPTLFD